MATLVLPQPASVEDKMAAFDSVPLFMKSLPEGDTEDATLGALQSLAYDGTPDGEQSLPVLIIDAGLKVVQRSPRTSRNKGMTITKVGGFGKRLVFTRRGSRRSRTTKYC
jgi:hypothetical protein